MWSLPSYQENVCQLFPSFLPADFVECQVQKTKSHTAWKLELPVLYYDAQAKDKLRSGKQNTSTH